MRVTLLQAARSAGIGKTTLRKATAAGKLTATRDPHGRIMVDMGDVERLWPRAPAPAPERAERRAGDRAPEVEAERAKVALLEAQVRDLQRRLDAEAEERRALTQRLLGPPEGPAAPARSWWQRWRGGSR